MDMDTGRKQQPAQGLHEQHSNSLTADDVDFGAPSLSPPPFQLQASDGFEEEQEAAGMGSAGMVSGGFATPIPPPDSGNDSSNTLQMQSATAAHPGGGVIQRTTFKLATAGDEAPEFHTTDPASYAKRTDDPLVEKSLHEFKPGDTVMQVATSPITIFMHGSTLAQFTAEKFFQYITERGFAPKPGNEIVFITCKGALQEDEFLVKKGQALADKLEATVHLAWGNVRINEQGVPVVAKASGSGTYPHIESKEEMARIIPKDAEGWKTYKPQGVTFADVEAEYKLAKRELRKYLKFEAAKADIEDRLDQMADYMELMKTDRRDIVQNFEYIKGLHHGAVEYWRPRQDFFTQVHQETMRIQALAIDHEAQAERIAGVAGEFTKIAEAIKQDNTEGNAVLEGLQKDYEDKQANLVKPLEADLAKATSEAEAKESAVTTGSGWDDTEDFFAGFADELDAEASHDADAKDTATGGSHEQDADQDGSPKTEQETEAVQTKMAPGNAGVVQRRIDDRGGALCDGRQLEDILTGLPNLDLVRGNNNMDLVIRFSDIEDEGVTKVLMDGEYIGRDSIVPANAGRLFTIEISLNADYHGRGLDPSKMGNLIETLTHEWMLHGQQYAVNINSMRYGLDPDLVIDHEALFEEDMSQMDIAIGLQMVRPENAAFREDIGASYLKDVRIHIDIITKGWRSDDMSKSKQFHQCLCELEMVAKNQAGLAEAKPELAAKLAEFLGDMDDFMAAPVEYDQFDMLETTEQRERLEAIREFDISDMEGVIQWMPNVTKQLLSLLRDISAVNVAQGIFLNPLGVRKEALATLGINADGLEHKAGHPGVGSEEKKVAKKPPGKKD